MASFSGWSSKSKIKSAFGGGKRRGMLQTTVSKQDEYSLSDVAAMKVEVSIGEDELKFTIRGRFVSLNFFKSRSWKEIKAIEDAIEDRIRNCLMAEFGKDLPIRFDSFTVDLRYNSLMDPDNPITVIKIVTDAIVDQYSKLPGGKNRMVDDVPVIIWKGLFFDDTKLFNAGITGMIPDVSLPHNTYEVTYRRASGTGRKMKKVVKDRMSKILQNYDRDRRN